MARCIEDMEDLLGRIWSPGLIKALSHSSDNILRCIASTLCLGIVLNELFHFFNILGKTFDRVSICAIAVVPVANKADSDPEFAIIISDDVVYDLLQSLLGSIDPRAHRTGAVKEET